MRIAINEGGRKGSARIGECCLPMLYPVALCCTIPILY